MRRAPRSGNRAGSVSVVVPRIGLLWARRLSVRLADRWCRNHRGSAADADLGEECCVVEEDGLLNEALVVEMEDAAATNVDRSPRGGDAGPRSVVGTGHPC